MQDTSITHHMSNGIQRKVRFRAKELIASVISLHIQPGRELAMNSLPGKVSHAYSSQLSRTRYPQRIIKPVNDGCTNDWGELWPDLFEDGLLHALPLCIGRFQYRPAIVA